MREIKYPRVWDDVLLKMLYSKFEQYDDMIGFRFEQHLETENPVYMWPTGLKDVNGKEIYEGDILEINHEDGYSDVYQVKYFADSDYPAFDLVPHMDCDSNGLSHAMAVCTVKKIGTIHENPELLNEK